MGGQILGGGAIAVVVAVLWLVYLVPSWQAKMRYNAAERNAVRLNQALRVLAETSETPEEVRVELSRREAARQHRLVRKLEAEDDRLREESDRAVLAQKKREVEAERLQRAIAVEEERRHVAALRADPLARQARARRRMRLSATTLAFLGLVGIAAGAWQLIATSQWAWLAGGAIALVAGLSLLRRMVTVASHARAARVADPVAEVARAPRVEQQLINAADRGWTPRRLPAPLTATAGSRAADQVGAASAREQLRQAAREEDARMRLAQEQAPVSLAEARAPQKPSEEYSQMGVVDDAEIEQHVRDLLARRAVG
ncbi:large exoprotein [Microbacterium sp. G2-8]|uniref:large exoprotein n=1 Tax=Microbacterium sp. G2-8 TaxID=2842454 RepID=UPI001C8958AB|nr:large exoprotein [Microbacterium sp. G2-8]